MSSRCPPISPRFRNCIITANDTGILSDDGGGILRLHWDSVSSYIYSHVDTPMFLNFSGFLDAKGRGLAVFNTVGPLNLSYAGETISFACVLIDPFELTSNPVDIDFQQ